MEWDNRMREEIIDVAFLMLISFSFFFLQVRNKVITATVINTDIWEFDKTRKDSHVRMIDDIKITEFDPVSK